MTAISGRTDAIANRQRVLRAARELFAERGLAVEMRDIAQRAGVGLGTLYRNVANRDELVQLIIAEFMAEVEATITTAAAIPDPLAAVQSMLDALFDLVDENGVLMDALRSAVPKDEQDHSTLFACLALVWNRAVEAGAVRDGLDPELLAELTGALFIVYVGLRSRRSAPEARRGCMTAFLHGVLAPRA